MGALPWAGARMKVPLLRAPLFSQETMACLATGRVGTGMGFTEERSGGREGAAERGGGGRIRA